MAAGTQKDPYDLMVIGGGINGCGIARDAAGRGASVMLVEQGDLAQATSSASTKLFHGGLRYLEFFEFRLVRESLVEREVLLRNMPHISWPMRFVLPYHPDQRFEEATPTSRLLGWTLPWLKGRRPAWLIRFGLFLYDTLGGRKILPGTRSVDLGRDPVGRPLQDKYRRAFEYSDCWVEDSRLVVLNARSAQAQGARIATRTKLTAAERRGDLWQVLLEDQESGAITTAYARTMVNAAGPWVAEVISGALRLNTAERVRLVRGSHIVTKRLYDHEKCYFFQGEDGRIIFAIPYETDFTLIGTTDQDHPDPVTPPECSAEEETYLCAFASRYFARPVTAEDVVWRYSGVRPLYDDGASSATAATRDYVLSFDKGAGAPLLNVFGGKITTYRRLAEEAVEKILPAQGTAWTHDAPLPGGNVAVGDVAREVDALARAYPFLEASQVLRLWRAYGTEAGEVLGAARGPEDLGQDFGAGLTAREVDWLVTREYARRAEDVLWRRSKLGLRMDAAGQAALEAYLAGSDGAARASG